MSTTDDADEKKPLQLSGRGRLELRKTVDAGQVRQQFPHGRQKTVQVEVKRKRVVAPGDAPAPRRTEERTVTPAQRGGGGRGLTADEQAARARALKDASDWTPDAPHSRGVMPSVVTPPSTGPRERIAAPKPAAAATPPAAAPAPPAPEAAAEAPQGRGVVPGRSSLPPRSRGMTAPQRVVHRTEPRRPAPGGARGGAAAEPPAADGRSIKKPPLRKADDADDAKGKKAVKPGDPRKAAASKGRGDARRRSGKLTITQALNEEEGERIRSLASVRRQRERERQRELRAQGGQEKFAREVVIPEAITVQELANRMAEKSGNVIKALMKAGVMATITQSIDGDTAELVVGEFGHKPKRVSEADVEQGLTGADDDDGVLAPRPPVVTVMGHVDHGKTSLLDALRSADIAAGEAGGITQHIGAYQIRRPDGQRITFIDTPGHAAFSEMRARGATVTDIVILVVAANDGVMPQTIEALRHAQAAGAPMIIAINKMDVDGADPNRVRTDLLQHDIQVENMGGEVIDVEVSAKTGAGLDKLVEMILLQAEVMELKANPSRAAEGVVVESKVEQGRGPVATVLIKRGTLKKGDIFVAGAEWGRARALLDEHGEALKDADPGKPVEVLGLQGSPLAGDEFVVVDDEARAREVSDYRQRQRREKDALAQTAGRGSLEQMFASIKAGEAKELPLVVKADVQGSAEAIIGSLEKMGTDEVKVRLLHSGVGAINESDVTLAKASDAAVIGFNVRANPQARDASKREGVDIRYYSIIYDLVDDIKALLSGMLAPQIRETFIGNAEIREVFTITKVGKVAGCYVTDGKAARGAKVRLLRDGVVIHQGALKTLRRFKDEVKEVQQGYECGMAFENYSDIQIGDVIECFEVEEVARSL